MPTTVDNIYTTCCTLISSGIPKECDNNIGGIQKMYITDLCEVDSITTTTGEVTGISMVSGGKYYEYDFNKFTSTFTETNEINIQNGSACNKQEVKLLIPRRDTTKRNNLMLLVNKNLSIIVLDANGLYWLIGELRGANLTASEFAAGTNCTDYNGWTLTFTANEVEPAKEVDGSIIASLI